MDATTLADLLAAVKTNLQITWSDQETDNRLTDLIRAGVFYLDSKRGAAGDYTSPGYPRTLLFEYVRYARDGALDVFENNYRALILAMQNERQVNAYAVAAGNAIPAQEPSGDLSGVQ